MPRRPLGFATGVCLALAVGWVSGHGQAPPGQQGPLGQQPRPGPAPVTGTGMIVGQVVDASTGKPVPEPNVFYLVRMTGPVGRGSVLGTTIVGDAQGRFVLANLAPGQITVSATKTGYAPASPNSQSKSIDLGDGEHVLNLKMRLVKFGSVSGVVRDDAGDPVVGTTMIAMRRGMSNGRPQWSLFRGAVSDDRGMFRITNLPPGDYYVCACLHDPIPLDPVLLSTLATEPVQLLGVAARALTVGADVATLDRTLKTMPPTFFPSGSTIARASRITIASAEDRVGVDIAIQPVRAARVSGTIAGATSPISASSLRLTPAGESDDALGVVQIPPIVVQPDGRFDFANVPPGSYVLHVISNSFAADGPSGAAMSLLGPRGQPQPAGRSMGGTPSSDPPLWANESISVPEEGLTGLVVTLQPSIRATGRVQYIGNSPPPTAQALANSGVIFNSLATDRSQMPGAAGVGRFTPDGSFTIPGMIPGRYSMSGQLGGFPGYSFLKSVVVNGADVTDLGFDVESGGAVDILVTYTDAQSPTLAASVTPVPQPGADDLAALIFPADRKYWADPAAASRRFLVRVFGNTGTFAPTTLPPGEYFVAAVTDTQTVDWQDAKRLDQLSKTAAHVTIVDGDHKNVAVKR
jgi:hypothetical protein